MMNRILSIHGWNPEELNKGDVVLFLMNHKMHVGVTEQDGSITMIPGGERCEPSRTDICRLNHSGNLVNEVKAIITEI